MLYSLLCLTFLLLSCYIQATQLTDSKPIDLFIYGATPAGIATALNAADSSSTLTIALVERTQYIGGMAGPGGIGFRDTHNFDLLNSSELEWAYMNAKYCIHNLSLLCFIMFLSRSDVS